MLAQCLASVAPGSQTMVQYRINVGSVYRADWDCTNSKNHDPALGSCWSTVWDAVSTLNLKALNYFYKKHGNRRGFSIWNHHKCLSYTRFTLGSRRPRFRPPWRKRDGRGATQGGGMDKLGRPWLPWLPCQILKPSKNLPRQSRYGSET